MEVCFRLSVTINILITVQGLLDFSREFDVGLMDKVVMALYTGSESEVCVRFRHIKVGAWSNHLSYITATNGATGINAVSGTP